MYDSLEEKAWLETREDIGSAFPMFYMADKKADVEDDGMTVLEDMAIPPLSPTAV